MNEFGERIYNLRKKSGLSQEEFADKLGVSRQAVSKWETGQSVPDTEKSAAISTLFGVSLDWLVYGEQIQTAPVVQPEFQPAAGPVAVKKKTGIGKALLIAGIITLSLIGLTALSTFIYALIVMKTANLADPETFYMLVMIVPAWTVLFILAFIVSVIVIRKRKK